jgi:hypothetical protein
MPRTQTAPAPPAEIKTHRIARPARKKPAPLPQFDAAEHYQEIAQLAYLNWLQRAGSPEEDWLKAEVEVRTRHTT